MIRFYKHIFLSAFLLFFSTSIYALPRDNGYVIVEKNDKKGLINDKKKVIIPAIYDDLGWSNEHDQTFSNVIGYKENGYWGVITTRNKKITEAIYNTVSPFKESYIICSKLNAGSLYYGVITTKGEAIVPFKYKKLSKIGGALIGELDEQGKKTIGIINIDNEIIIPFNNSQVSSLTNGLFLAKDFNDKIAIYDLSGQQKIPYELDSVWLDSYIIVIKEGNKGVVSLDGDMIVPFHYKLVYKKDQSIDVLAYPKWYILDFDNNIINTFESDSLLSASENTFILKREHFVLFVDSTGEPLSTPKQELSNFKYGLSIFKEKSKFGLIHQSGKEILPPKFDDIFFDSMCVITKVFNGKKENWQMYNLKGEKLHNLPYQEMREPSEARVAAQREGKWGYLDYSGREIIPCEYERVRDFQEGYAVVHARDKVSIIDKHGKWLLHPNEGNVRVLSQGRFFISNIDNVQWVYNRQGKKIHTTKNKLEPHALGLIEIDDEGKQGLLLPNGEYLLPVACDEISALQADQYIFYSLNGKWGIMNNKGKTLVTHIADCQKLYTLNEEFIDAKIDGKYGFVDVNGKLRIANRYDKVFPFKEGLAPVNLMNKWAYIDKLERIIIQPLYDQARPFDGELAIVKNREKFGLINKKGEVVLPLEYDRIKKNTLGNYLLFLNGKVGLASAEGLIRIYPKFNEITDLQNGYVIVKRDDKYSVLNDKGVSIIPLTYHKILFDPYNNVFIATKKESNWKTYNVEK